MEPKTSDVSAIVYNGWLGTVEGTLDFKSYGVVGENEDTFYVEHVETGKKFRVQVTEEK